MPEQSSCGSGGSSSAASGGCIVFDLTFRPASLEALDNDTLPIDVPTFVPMESRWGVLTRRAGGTCMEGWCTW